MRRYIPFFCLLVLCSACALAADLSSLPLDAQKAIASAIKNNAPARKVQRFTLTASDGEDKDSFGASVAIDGDTIVVSSHSELDEVYVFVRPKSGWQNMTQTAILSPSDFQNASGFGGAVGISGNTIVVGAPGAQINGSFEGAVYLFVRPAGGWTNMTQTAKLTGSGLSANTNLGAAVAISGGTVAAGVPSGLDGNGPGIVFEFTEAAGGWTDMTQTAELSTSDGFEYDNFGENVAVSGNTILAAICGCGSGYPQGAAYMFVEPPTGWRNKTETAKLTASDGEIGDGFGISVSLSGGVAVVGSVDHGVSGAAYVFLKPEGVWANATQAAELNSDTSGVSFLGDSVSIDGHVIVAGAETSFRSQGVAPLFLEPNGGWQNTSNPNSILGAPFTYAYDDFGNSVGVSGKTVVVGAIEAPTSPPCKPYCQAGPGEAIVFVEQ